MNATMELPRRITPEEFDRRGDTRGYELIDGRMVEKAMGMESNWTALHLIHLIWEFFGDLVPGWFFCSECSYQCFPHAPNRIRKPDISFIRFGRLPNEELMPGHCTLAPDLIAESVSPNDLTEEIEERVADFLKAGTELVWVLYPKTRHVMVHRQDGSVTKLTGEMELSGETVLPGFTVKVAKLFPPKRSPEGNGHA